MIQSNDVKSILFNEAELDAMTTRIAAEIDRDFANSERRLVMVCILKGAVMFFVDLIRKVRRPLDLEFMKVSSYGAGTSTSGNLAIHLDLKLADLSNTDILLVEDIIDSGRTLSRLTALLRERGAASVHTCTLLDKPCRREVEFEPDYRGAEIPDHFVVGYGLDYNEQYRDLPYIGVLDPSVYQ